jgi:pyruvate/2-oxoglutarate dehydrogenase complex dihydrolipoamide dehydrogenase (E3) component
MNRTQNKIKEINDKKGLVEHLEEFGVKVFSGVGETRFVSPTACETAGGMTFEAEKFILCAGGYARRLTFPGSDLAQTHSDVWSLDKLPKSVAIVGGAATGCQLASVLAAFGSNVWLFEIAPHLLSMEDSLISETIGETFSQRGIEIITGIGGVEKIEESDQGLILWYKLQDQVKQVTVDAVIMATGWPGNADSLNLEAAGVHNERGYVLVDEYLRSSASHIFAAGDITGRIPWRRPAIHT